MPISARGNETLSRAAARARARGFTLLELMVVVTLIAIVSALASLALRDPDSTQLEREATRLAALLESARAESRSLGVEVRWMPGGSSTSNEDFHFAGLPSSIPLPTRWLDADVQAQALLPNGAPSPLGVVLGPEPIIGAQRIVLSLRDQRLTLVTDGLSPFAIEGESAPSVATLSSAQDHTHEPS